MDACFFARKKVEEMKKISDAHMAEVARICSYSVDLWSRDLGLAPTNEDPASSGS